MEWELRKNRKRERSSHRDRSGDRLQASKKQNLANDVAKFKSKPEPSKSSSKNQRRHGKAPVSPAALELSSQLKKLSQEKKWKEALDVYQDAANNAVRDSHHACIMVDMAARCGRITEGERIFNEMENQKTKISVELKTALIKGYAHSGMLQKADTLFHSMCSSKSKSSHPNVRTLNTILRGCLWSAVMVDGHDSDTLVGGIISAERAWTAYYSLHNSGDASAVFDVSSYEYYITLMCQALQLDDAEAKIAEMKMAFGLSKNSEASTASDDQSVTETLAMVYLALGRAYAILGEGSNAVAACKQSLKFAETSRRALKSNSSFSRKRAWKENPGDEENRRTQSNTIYRDHRLTEIASEAQIVLEICQKSGTMKDISARDLTRRLATRLVYLSGGGTTPEHGTGDRAGQIHSSSKTIQRAFMNSLFFSFGVSTTVSKLNIPISKDSLKTLSQKEANRILGSVGLQGGIVKNDGTLDIHRIFSAGIGNAKTQKKRKKKTQKIEVELGAGFGDWIVQKAVEDPATNYMAVELRADRVAQIYARTAILSYDTPVNNLCVVGGDSGNFLLNFLTPESVDTVYVNHPEPPTQTFGAESDALKAITQGGDEPAHMLHSNILIAAAKALKKRSKLVIVTDNKWYGMLICATLSKVKKANPKLLDNHDLHHDDQSFHQIDSHKSDGLGETEHFVPLFEGQPNKTIGYPSQKSGRGDSYFDRLWRAGGGTHAEKRSRFVIIQKRGNLDGV